MSDQTIAIANHAAILLGSSELCGGEAARVKEVMSRLENQEITVSVIGQFKRGKSTLVNAILGEQLMPVGIVPVTSAVTRVRYGQRSAAVHFENGAVQQVEPEELAAYISEQSNPDNGLGVASVTLQTPADFLKDGITFVDTPGVGSVHRHNSDAAYAFAAESDAVIFMLSVDSPINEIEIDFLRRAREYAAKFYFAVNKIDTVTEDELEIYLDYCRRLLCSLLDVQEVQMFPVSARSGTGLTALRESIEKDCRESVREILDASARKKLYDIIGRAVSQLNLYWKALNMVPSSFDERFAAMEESFAEQRTSAEEAVARLNEEADRIETELEQIIDREFDYWMDELTEMGRAEAETCLRKIYEKGRKQLRRDFAKIANGMELHRNEVKRALSAAVLSQFGMEYHYELTELDVSGRQAAGAERAGGELPGLEAVPAGSPAKPDEAPLTREDLEHLRNAFLEDYSGRLEEGLEELAGRLRGETEQLCDELYETLSRVLLYREQSTYAVARRIEDLNQLTRKLKRLRERL